MGWWRRLVVQQRLEREAACVGFWLYFHPGRRRPRLTLSLTHTHAHPGKNMFHLQTGPCLFLCASLSFSSLSLSILAHTHTHTLERYWGADARDATLIQNHYFLVSIKRNCLFFFRLRHELCVVYGKERQREREWASDFRRQKKRKNDGQKWPLVWSREAAPVWRYFSCVCVCVQCVSTWWIFY